jgi:hypothetical protein
MRGDDDYRRIRVLLPDPGEVVEAFTSIGCRALEIEVEEDRVGTLALQQRQQFLRRGKGGDFLEQLAKRQSRRKGDVRIIIDDDRQPECRFHATPLVALSGNEQCQWLRRTRRAIGTRLA